MARSRVSARRRAHELAALAVLLSMPGQWLGAIEVADSVQRPCAPGANLLVLHPIRQSDIAWRVIAFALRGLVAQGLVEERIVSYRSKHRSKECRRLYCAAREPVVNPLLPTPHRIPPGVARLVIGRASLR